MDSPSLSEQVREAGYECCSLCGTWEPQEEIVRMEVEEPGVRQPVCPECQATLERVR